ncbi:LacI family DNA-binding transcriptional regulator [Amnibacterium kyonggiense]|uniref:LacI family transcriptional regulator n=1 Tax=Amnibacterium kyonggiense TaxID=595671 RepID=A0A4R7FQ59_9MICO|nr:LacI family DNA-binding transcriptional regulator [Amnibacterium kyonggiense]TDS79905.1 LacI family transcriptional regulator [Amnibacterium kyonggiense]
MGGKPTIADVARAAGVSKGLVSFALNDRPGVAPATKRRILAAADELGFRPSVQGRSLSTRLAYSVGLVLARDADLVAADPFYPPFLAGAERVLVAAGRTLTLSVLDRDRDEEAHYRALVADRRVDGVIVGDLRPADPRLPLLAELGLPAVTLGRTGDPRFPAVSVDDAKGVAETARHLLTLGHRRIAMVAGPRDLVHGARRADAFRAALAAAGLEPVAVVETDFTPLAAARATSDLLAAGERPTAVVYGNDVAAAAGISVIRGHGLGVPEDIAVCGFDDAEIAQWTVPSLTTVSTGPARWGAAAAEALLDLLAGERVEDRDLEPARLVVRDSTGVVPRTTRAQDQDQERTT